MRRVPAPLLAVLGFGMAFLYAPILVLVIFSFNSSALVTVWGGFSSVWYGRLLHNRQVLDAALLSLKVGAAAASWAVLLGLLAAIALVRLGRFRFRFLLAGMIHAPLVVPEIITGITLLLLFVSMQQMFGWPRQRGFSTLVLAHISFCMAYVTVTVLPRVASADMDLEEAAMDLGAGRLRAFIEITLPIILPALISGWLLCFTLSLDDLVISSFVTGPGSSTLPMVIYSKVKLGVSPDMNALASLVILLVSISVACAGWLMHRAERQRLADVQLAKAANEIVLGAP